MKKLLLASTLSAVTLLSGLAHAADYNVDREGAHAAINFKVQHLGYSWLTGRFNDFDGSFSYDKDKSDTSQIKVVIQTASLDSNHAERDKHLKGKEFLDVYERIAPQQFLENLLSKKVTVAMSGSMFSRI